MRISLLRYVLLRYLILVGLFALVPGVFVTPLILGLFAGEVLVEILSAWSAWANWPIISPTLNTQRLASLLGGPPVEAKTQSPAKLSLTRGQRFAFRRLQACLQAGHPTFGTLFPQSLPRIVTLLALSLGGVWLTRRLLNADSLSLLLAGVGIGAALREVSNLNMFLQQWPGLRRIIDPAAIDALLARAAR
jgi:hypothetical protein